MNDRRSRLTSDGENTGVVDALLADGHGPDAILPRLVDAAGLCAVGIEINQNLRVLRGIEPDGDCPVGEHGVAGITDDAVTLRLRIGAVHRADYAVVVVDAARNHKVVGLLLFKPPPHRALDSVLAHKLAAEEPEPDEIHAVEISTHHVEV